MTRRGCGCCETCTIFDYTIESIAAFAAGVTYDGTGSFDGTLEPGESIVVTQLIAADTEPRSLYRVYVDPSNNPEMVTETHGIETGSTVTFPVAFTGLTTGTFDVTVEVDVSSASGLQGFRGSITFPSTTEWEFLPVGTLSGTGSQVYSASTSAAVEDGNFVVEIEDTIFSSVYLSGITITVATTNDDPTIPIELTLSVRNGSSEGFDFVLSQPDTLGDGRKICNPLRIGSDVYQVRTVVRGELSITAASSADYSVRDYFQAGFIDTGTYRSWEDSVYWFKEGQSQPLLFNADYDAPAFTDSTAFTDPVVDIRLWDNEIAALGYSETTVTYSPEPGGMVLAPIMGKLVAENVEVTLTNDGAGSFRVKRILAEKVQGLDPADIVDCEELSPSGSPLNSDCNSYQPPCPALDDIRQYHMLATDLYHPNLGFKTSLFRGGKVCAGSASSFCGSELDGAGPDEVLMYASEFTDPPEMEEAAPSHNVVLNSSTNLGCSPPDDPAVKKYDLYQFIDDITHTVIGPLSPYDIKTGDVSTELDWDISWTVTRSVGTTTGYVTPTIRFWRCTSIGATAAVGRFVVIPVSNEIVKRRLDEDGATPTGASKECSQCGYWVTDRTLADLVGYQNEPLLWEHTFSPVEVDLCDLVPGWEMEFEVTASEVLTFAKTWTATRLFSVGGTGLCRHTIVTYSNWDCTAAQPDDADYFNEYGREVTAYHQFSYGSTADIDTQGITFKLKIEAAT